VTQWIGQLIRLAGLNRNGYWTGATPDTGGGNTGTGRPIVEVVVRQKSPTEKFVFCLNQGGAGDGRVTVPVGDGSWKAEDVVTGDATTQGRVRDGSWVLPLHLAAWGYRVIRLVRD
jgi:hypothetical protein